MTNDPSHAEIQELRETSWPAMVLCCLGGLGVLLSLILIPLDYFSPPKNVAPNPWGKYVIPPISALILFLGIYWIKKSPVGLRLTTSKLELPRLGVSIPWAEIENVNIFHPPQGKDPYPPRPLLLLLLTPAGRNLVGNKMLANSPHAVAINPRPDVCLKLSFYSFGAGIHSAAEFAVDLRRRIAVASQDPEAASESPLPPALPALESPLELRDMSAAGQFSRVYIHDMCGRKTVITESSLNWITNPLRYAYGGKCAFCGMAYPHTLRWEDTGESIARFRSRMWRRTPLKVKLLQFALMPLLIGAVVAVVFGVLVPGAATIPLTTKIAIDILLGLIAGYLLTWVTPLAGVIPAMSGLTYSKYR